MGAILSYEISPFFSIGPDATAPRDESPRDRLFRPRLAVLAINSSPD
jgi:hypothetical protein